MLREFLQVLKPFGNSLLMIAAMTYAKNNADIETMASLEVQEVLKNGLLYA